MTYVTEEASSVETKKLNILVVDDDPAVRKYISDALGTTYFSVMNARDGVDALRLIDSSPESIDVLLVDIVMPRLNGNELARVIQSWHPNIKIIFMSGYPVDFDVHQGVSTGDVRYLRKPFTLDCLLRAVKESR